MASPDGKDLDIKHDMHSDCPVHPNTRVRVQYAGLDYDPTGRLARSEGRAGEFLWNTDKTRNTMIVVRYEIVEPTKFQVFSDALASLCILHEVHIEGDDCGTVDVYDLDGERYEDLLCDKTKVAQ